MERQLPKYGYIAGSDIVTLSADLSIKNDTLIDNTCGIKHLLNPVAASSVKFLLTKPMYEEWVSFMFRQGLKTSNIYEILEFLNNIGGLVVNRKIKSKLVRFIDSIKAVTIGAAIQSISERRSSNILGVIIASYKVSLPVLIISSMVALLFLASGLNDINAWFFLPAFLATVFISLVVHEYAHIYMLNTMDVRSLILTKGLRLGVVHKKLSQSKEMKVAIIGPIAGALSSLVVALAWSYVFQNKSLILIGLIVSAFHFTSWLPLYGDGKTLFNKLKEAV